MTVALALVTDAQHQPEPELEPTPKRPLLGVLVGGALTALALVLLGLLAQVGLVSHAQESRDQRLLRTQLSKELKAGTAPTTLPLVAGKPLFELRVPTIDLDTIVAQGSTAGDLEHGPGHRASSPLPAQAGVSVVAGRHASYGGPFGRLNRLRVGDTLITSSGLGTHTFTIDDIRHDGNSVSLPPGDARLQLVTSEPSWAPHHVLVVSAVLTKGNLQPAAHGLPAPAADEDALAGDTSAALPAALWAGVLLVASIGLSWAWQRLARPVVWVGAFPLVLTVLWQLADQLARLLPSTL